MAHYRLSNVGVFVDVNGQQCDGAMSLVMNIEPLAAKLEAFGARAFDVDGHDLDALFAPTQLPMEDRPLFVLARTDPTRGVPLLAERAPQLHYLRFASEEEKMRYRDFHDKLEKES